MDSNVFLHCVAVLRLFEATMGFEAIEKELGKQRDQTQAEADVTRAIEESGGGKWHKLPHDGTATVS